MSRLDKQRQELLEPQRMEIAIKELEKLGFEVDKCDDAKIQFLFKGHTVTYFVYSGWASGKSIQDGRGLQPLLSQLNGSKSAVPKKNPK